MKFRPCIDLHNGKVKQIVGSTLLDQQTGSLVTNFESELSAAEFAALYKNDHLTGGHVIQLGPGNEQAAMAALRAYPGGLQIGGGITPDNALRYLEAGASHVIVTSYVFREGTIDFARLKTLSALVGRQRLVLDLSCRKRNDRYYVVTDRWQKFTDYEINPDHLRDLAGYCAEFLIHAVDVEGMCRGIEEQLVSLLGDGASIPTTYAGGVKALSDLDLVNTLGQGKVDLTIGSALDLFGGSIPYKEVIAWHKARPA
ncbi:MAG: 1-(5-phosphoribosyl)-5-[(5-phosphoribosylamino)m ethylideneamino] imidazole-4-carboxamide isomerase [Bacilli bacterium]|nr:1-(5-phosphoribosyl)-5-[(5-phosphoribosylamino)m ethylideneamino] imidazole-4-carboxamide isomerase [Bacilli bacterium]